MEYRELGRSGLKASAVGLGTWAIGGGPWWGENDDRESIRTIQAALDHGINLIDTAPAYGFGRSEEVVGKALQGRREQAIIATKCGLWWNDKTGTPFFRQAGHDVRRSLDPQTIRIEVEYSLRRLRTDYIDVLQTHWPAVEPFNTPIADTMACLLKLQREGKIRAIGASNVTTEQMDRYRIHGVLDVCQPRYSLLDRASEADILPYCQRRKIATLVYSPLEQGLLTGKIGLRRKIRPEEYRAAIPWYEPTNRRRVLKMLDGWKDLATKYDCRLGQLVIAWTVVQPGVTVALCGARRVEHVLENAGAGNIALEAMDIRRLGRDAVTLGKPVS